jgi:hypothetical protein
MQTKTHQDLQPKNNQTKHEFFAILVILVMWFWMEWGVFGCDFFFLKFFLGEKHLWWNFSLSYNLNERKRNLKVWIQVM